jgi:hypothetical protein
MWRFAPLGLVVCISGAACELPVDCDTGVEPTIDVIITDSVTGEPRAREAWGDAASGGFTDSLRLHLATGNLVWLSRAAWVPGGVYTVRVFADGYAPWQRAGVRSRSERCGTVTVTIEARLVPLP